MSKLQTMNQHIEHLRARIEPIRQQIIHHEVYSLIKTVEDLKVFMAFHVYAVWDFMSLLKTLQNNLTCTTVPWFPVGTANTRYLINEIVVGEESDVDLQGIRKSHFEMYLDAMQQAGADTQSITKFISTLQTSGSFADAHANSHTPVEAKDFVDFTFEIIASDKAYLQSAIFTFGREDLIPGMFISMIEEVHKNFPDQLAAFKYYIERHIEVDGGHHGQLALDMTEQLCGQEAARWEEAEAVVLRSLQKRKGLWDGVCRVLKQA
jgi:hypothetical protein